jgi:SAM-dependent methyltransferase
MAASSVQTGDPGSPSAGGRIPSEYAELSEYFDRFAATEPSWRRRNRYYHGLLRVVYRFHVPARASVLEIGCGSGDLLAALEPSAGLGIDISASMVALARERHPDIEFRQIAGEELDEARTFDYIVLSDLLPFVHDLLGLFEKVRRHSKPSTRVIVNSHSEVWRPILRLAEAFRLKPAKPTRNWVAPDDLRNVLELCGLELVTHTRRILMPKYVPLLSLFMNGIVANLWPFNYLCLTNWIVARIKPTESSSLPSVSVVCPCRNEAGHIPDLLARLPEIGSATELIFVEGGSSDDTRAVIEREIAAHPKQDIRLVDQPGSGKADAVRAGFAAAKHDVLLILDGDLSVSPEDLPKFVVALANGRGELINGSRLVYDVEPGAMRFLNLFGNKAFSWIFAVILRQRVKDTLCGTKALSRANYALIVEGRDYFGDFDPFGDFDLLLGAGRLGLKIVDLPVRYHARLYGRTNISRFGDGVRLLRMTLFAFSRFQIDIYRSASIAP